MAAGQYIWKRITDACESWNISPKFKLFLERFNKNFKVENWDPTTESIFSEVASKISQDPKSLISQFNKNFFYEFKDELFEEASESWFEEIWNWLKKDMPWLAILLSWCASLATAWHCITPGWNMTKMYKENWISVWDFAYNPISNAIEVTLDYNGNRDAIIKYYTDNWYTEANWHLMMQNAENPKLTNVIHLKETKVPIEVRSLASLLSWYWISVDRETWKWYYQELSKIKELEMLWKVNVIKDTKTKKVTILSWETTLELEQDYFGWRPHRFDVNTTQALTNSMHMDIWTDSMIEWNPNPKILDEARQAIQEQYEEASWKKIQLTDEEVIAIFKAYKEASKLWNLEIYEALSTIDDWDVISFVLEAWFWLKIWEYTINEIKLADHNEKIQKLKKWDIINIIKGNSEIKLEELSVNDLRLLMFKACNMWLDFHTIEKLWVAIEHSLLNNPEIEWNTKTELRNYVNYLCYITEINNININEDADRIEVALDDIQQQIDISFKESPTMAKELSIEINKKKFELYKKNWNIEQAQNMVKQIREQNAGLLSNDATNFRYRRWLLETDLLEIQLWWEWWKKALDWLTSNAQKVREKAETIWWRTDTETLISKIEAWILLWKSTEELQPYLDFLALAEHWAWVEILWAVIQTINTTFEWADWLLKEYANNVNEAWKKSNDTKLLEAWNKATEISERYDKMKNGLDTDKNWETYAEIQKRLEKFVKERPVSSVSDFWNDFSHFTILLNSQATRNSPVMSIEIWKTDYEAAYKILSEEIKIDNLMRESKDYNDFIQKLNSAVDNRIRTTFWTENLQELNSSKHRALFDYIAAKYMEWRRDTQSSSLTNLSQLFGIKWLQDCRLHAFTKQLFFDSWRTNTLNNLEKSRTWNPTTDAEIDKQIKIIENTKMTFLDAQFSWNVDMNTVYVARTEGWYMTRWSQNNVIEEHTFNLIEMPVLDTDWNIQYNEDWTIKKKACFADSFYHWNDGKVYNLSYTWKDISQSIYWKKWEEVYMTTTVTGADWKPIQINIKPLTRSMKWRWDNIVWSSIETRWPSTTEAATLNAQYDEWLKTVEVLNKNQTEIQSNLKSQLDKLESGQKVDLTNIEKALTSTEWHKVAERQANQIKRAFELFEKVPTAKKAEAIISLQTMIANTVTQQEIDYAWKTGSATEFLQTEWVFFDKMQIFNDVYKVEIEEARKQLDPNNPDSIKRLQDAIKKYQEIYDSDMKNFFERSQQTMLDDWKRWPEYHRNNFEHVAKRFQDDMKVYAEALKSLENAWKFDEAYEIISYMVEQENTLLQFVGNKFDHMIDFKKVKKEMKWIKWREIYNQLKEIQSKNIMNFESELKKQWLDRNNIKEMTWLDETAPLNKENLDKAIANIEESWLKAYYDTIALVFNPDILTINMENAVYSSNPVYTSETENWRIFAAETKKEYIDRKTKESDLEKNINNNTQAGEIQKICDWIVDNAKQKIPNWNEVPQIKSTISELIHFCKINGIKWKAMYDLCKMSTEALIFQTIESKTRSTWDHWINHISWNIQKLNTYIEAWVKAWKIPAGEAWKYKLMWALTHIFHDIWYAATVSKWSNSFDGSQIHPFTSKAFFDSKVVDILSNAKINTDLIWKAIESHDGIRLNWGSPETTFLSMVNLSDNMALWVDKIAEIWSNPHLLRHLATLYALDAAWLDIKKTHETMIAEINKDPNLNENQKETLKSAMKEISSFSMGNIDFWSISPLTAMEFDWDVPTLSMFKWVNIMLVAEMCGIDKVKLENAIQQYNEWKINDDKIKMEEARKTVVELIKWPNGKWTKFCSQIIKPLWDYSNIYTIHNANWTEYTKIDWKYDMDEVKADLLLWNTVSLKDWSEDVLHYKYEEATEGPNWSIEAEKNSVYWNIDMAEMLWKWVEAMKRLNTSAVVNELGSINKTTTKILDNIKDKEYIDINKATSSIEEAIDNLDLAITNEEVTVNEEFKSKFESLKDKAQSLINSLKENNYENIKPIAESVQEEVGLLSSLLIK